jgi:GNAT superfamily N-acetyltransferase
MRHGVGRVLVHDIVAQADRRFVEGLEVIANPHALVFYENVGFVHDGDVETAFGLGRRMHLDIAAPVECCRGRSYSWG